MRKLEGIAAVVAASLLIGSACAFAGEHVVSLPSETPADFKPRTDEFDYVKREEMIPMRDGVLLKTFILTPKGAREAPILLTRTPYNASERVLRFNSSHLAAMRVAYAGERNRHRASSPRLDLSPYILLA